LTRTPEGDAARDRARQHGLSLQRVNYGWHLWKNGNVIHTVRTLAEVVAILDGLAGPRDPVPPAAPTRPAPTSPTQAPALSPSPSPAPARATVAQQAAGSAPA
jgi:hypothetical protein